MSTQTELNRAKEKAKQLAMARASNELLAESILKVEQNDKMSEEEKAYAIEKINLAIEENDTINKTRLNATPEQVRRTAYGKPSEASIQRYEEMLSKRGITAEQNESKANDIDATVTTSKTAKTTKNRKHKTRNEIEREKQRILAEENMRIVRVKDEEELMRKSRIEDDNAPTPNSFRNTQGSVIEQKKNEPIVDKKIEVADPPQVKVDVESHPKSEASAKIQKMQDSYKMSSKEAPVGVEFDMIPLPSNGECYPSKLSRIKVRGLTANDENILMSPNMYRDGHIIDVILKETILTDDIKVEDLCRGDRDAIVLWLRSTAYGPEFPVYFKHPETGKQYNTIVRLDEFPYKDFNLKGDENGHFTYKTAKGDIIKFRCLTYNDHEYLRKLVMEESYSIDKQSMIEKLKAIRTIVNETNMFKEDTTRELNDYLDDFDAIISESISDIPTDEQLYSQTITKQMAMYTVSVNGNDDREFVETYIKNMMIPEARAYRQYVASNVPGVDFQMTIDIPESDGGGSFKTFLELEDTVFINV